MAGPHSISVRLRMELLCMIRKSAACSCIRKGGRGAKSRCFHCMLPRKCTPKDKAGRDHVSSYKYPNNNTIVRDGVHTAIAILRLEGKSQMPKGPARLTTFINNVLTCRGRSKTKSQPKTAIMR
eukprot:4176769-Pleurochrysis_carterae.AAC.1